jgi:hypothetical protein
MSAVASITYLDFAEAEMTDIAMSERQLDELFTFCDRLHRANIEHDAHSCVLCFEQR